MANRITSMFRPPLYFCSYPCWHLQIILLLHLGWCLQYITNIPNDKYLNRCIFFYNYALILVVLIIAIKLSCVNPNYFFRTVLAYNICTYFLFASSYNYALSRVVLSHADKQWLVSLTRRVNKKKRGKKKNKINTCLKEALLTLDIALQDAGLGWELLELGQNVASLGKDHWLGVCWRQSLVKDVLAEEGRAHNEGGMCAWGFTLKEELAARLRVKELARMQRMSSHIVGFATKNELTALSQMKNNLGWRICSLYEG